MTRSAFPAAYAAQDKEPERNLKDGWGHVYDKLESTQQPGADTGSADNEFCCSPVVAGGW